MTPIDYCLLVQHAVRNSRPDSGEQSEIKNWFRDTGRISTALSFALEGKRVKALEIAERLAEKYHKQFSVTIGLKDELTSLARGYTTNQEETQ